MTIAGSTGFTWFALLLPAVSAGYCLGRAVRAGAAARPGDEARAQDSAEPPQPAPAPHGRVEDSSTDAHRWTALVAGHRGISVLISDRDHLVLWVNDTFTELFGYTAAEAKGRPVAELLFFEGTDMATVERARERYAQKTGARFEVLVRTKSGAERWIEADVQALHDPSGEVEGYMAIHRDVTEQVSLREARRISEHRARTMMACVDLGSWELDLERGVVSLNESFCRMLGYEPDELHIDAAGLRELCHPDDRAEADR
ncbi:MAG TPA: PAS domain S-box protein, partial [Steroidobacteraceae bacterium]|nr:PAS domain S-box protein [Steroidobacteraceae bacterium]